MILLMDMLESARIPKLRVEVSETVSTIEEHGVMHDLVLKAFLSCQN